MTDALRVGVIGLGWIGRDHLGDLAVRPDVDVVAVCDIDPTVAEKAGSVHSALAYTDGEQLLESADLDAVWVCTPPQFHAGPAVQAMELGIPVYLEKPIARDPDDARLICAAARRTGVVCSVGYQWHSLELVDVLREELSGQRVAALFGQSIGPTAARPWFLKQSQSGGNLLERGSHHLDLARAIGGEVAQILVVASAVRLQRGLGTALEGGAPAPDETAAPAGSDIDDALSIVLRYPDGATANIGIAWSLDGAPSHYGLDVIAERGAYHLELDPSFTLTGMTDGRLVSASSTPAFRRSNDRFIDAVRSADPSGVVCTPADAARTLALALAGERSLATGAWVDV